MRLRCPGQDFRWLSVESYKCPSCGAEEEIFSNETRVKCPGCGGWIYKEKLPSCIDWCASARQCLGEERWKQVTGCDSPEDMTKAGKRQAPASGKGSEGSARGY